jgi:triosephosphate isomerase
MMTRSPRITFPLVAVNFKTYSESLGEAAVKLAKIAEDVSLKTGVCIAVAPQLVDLSRIVTNVKIPILAQHVDPYDSGPYTGHSSIDAVKQAGATGSIINHSEHMLKLSDIDQIIRKMRRLELTSIVCTNTPQVSAAVAALEPDIIAIEPPELIGTGIPVSKSKPEIVTDTISLIKRINTGVRVLCGAGITKGEDAAAAIELGTLGVLVSSGVVKAQDPSRALTDLAEAVRK